MKICTWNSQGNPLNDAIKLNRDIQLIPTLYFLKTAKYQIVLREKWSWRII